MGVSLAGRALRFNLFARASQKGFPLQSLTRLAQYQEAPFGFSALETPQPQNMGEVSVRIKPGPSKKQVVLRRPPPT